MTGGNRSWAQGLVLNGLRRLTGSSTEDGRVISHHMPLGVVYGRVALHRDAAGDWLDYTQYGAADVRIGGGPVKVFHADLVDEAWSLWIFGRRAERALRCCATGSGPRDGP